jgi:hypothetical protein
MSYVTLEQFKEAVTIADTVDDGDLQRALDAASQWIDSYTGRTFGAVTGPEARLFTAVNEHYLHTGDVSSVTVVAIDREGDGSFGTELAATDYRLYPLNGPYTEIRLTSSASYLFVVGELVSVTGAWGFGSVPAVVEQACILLANRYFHRLSAPFGVLEGPQTGELGRIDAVDPDVASLLSAYTSGGVIAGSDAWVLV